MSPLTDAEKQKIIEEERIRADERAKYSAALPQQVVIKEKPRTSGCTVFILFLIILGIVMAVLAQIGSNAGKEAQQSPSTSIAPSTSPSSTESNKNPAPLGITRNSAINYFKKLGFSITASENAKDVYVGTTPNGGAKGYNVLSLSGPAENLNRIGITGILHSNFSLTDPTMANVISFAAFFGDDSKAWITEQLKNIPTNPSVEQKATKIFNNKNFEYSYSPSPYFNGIYLDVTSAK